MKLFLRRLVGRYVQEQDQYNTWVGLVVGLFLGYLLGVFRLWGAALTGMILSFVIACVLYMDHNSGSKT